MASADPYDLLGVARDAPRKDIQKAYRRRAKEVHPDLNPAMGTRCTNSRPSPLPTAFSAMKPNARALTGARSMLRGPIGRTGDTTMTLPGAARKFTGFADFGDPDHMRGKGDSGELDVDQGRIQGGQGGVQLLTLYQRFEHLVVLVLTTLIAIVVVAAVSISS